MMQERPVVRSSRRVGRPPRLQAAIVNVLRVHPELMGRPSKIAELLVRAVPGFEDVDGKKVSMAFTKLRRRFGDGLEPRELHSDTYHVDRIVTVERERVCQGCGASLGFVSTARDLRTTGHNSFDNRLHRVFQTRPIPMAGRETMISQAAVVAAEFGDGVEGRLTRKALTGLEELCKSMNREELPQEITTQLAGLVEAECRKRAKSAREARIEEAKDCVTYACLEGMERFPSYATALRMVVRNAASYFPDLTVGANRSSRRSKPNLLEEEERTYRAEEEQAPAREPVAALAGPE